MVWEVLGEDGKNYSNREKDEYGVNILFVFKIVLKFLKCGKNFLVMWKILIWKFYYWRFCCVLYFMIEI